MAPRKRKKRRLTKLALVVITLVCLSAVSALAVYVVQTPANKVPKAEHWQASYPDVQRKPREAGPSVAVRDSRPAGSVQDRGPKVEVDVVKPHFEKSQLKFSREKRAVPRGEDARVFAVNQFIQTSGVAPQGARLLSVSVREGTATLSFNRKLDGGYGSGDEATLVNGVVEALAQFPDIQSVAFTIEGEPIESLGHFEIGSPVPIPGREARPKPIQP